MNSNFNPIDLLKNEQDYLYQLTSEYLEQANRYKNLFRYSIPVRILTPDENKSVYDTAADLTYDKKDYYLTGYVYTLYEYVPVYYTNPLMFNPVIDNEQGLKIDTNLTVSLVGFDDITIGSYVMFYSDYLSNIIFEVSNIRTPLLSNVKLPVFELDLIKSTLTKDQLMAYIENGQTIIGEIYYYDYTSEKFIPKSEYEEKLNSLEQINSVYIPFFKEYFDYLNEAYYYIDENGNKIYEKYLNLYFLDFIGDYVNKNWMRLDFPIPAAPLINPQSYTPTEVNYQTQKYNPSFWKTKIEDELLPQSNNNEVYIKLNELHNILTGIITTS